MKGCDGMDGEVIMSYLPLYGEAALLTVRVGVGGIVLAIMGGLCCSMIQ